MSEDETGADWVEFQKDVDKLRARQADMNNAVRKAVAIRRAEIMLERSRKLLEAMHP